MSSAGTGPQLDPVPGTHVGGDLADDQVGALAKLPGRDRDSSAIQPADLRINTQDLYTLGRSPVQNSGHRPGGLTLRVQDQANDVHLSGDLSLMASLPAPGPSRLRPWSVASSRPAQSAWRRMPGLGWRGWAWRCQPRQERPSKWSRPRPRCERHQPGPDLRDFLRGHPGMTLQTPTQAQAT